MSMFVPISLMMLFKVDIIKSSALPVLKRFLGTDEGLEIKVYKNCNSCIILSLLSFIIVHNLCSCTLCLKKNRTPITF